MGDESEDRTKTTLYNKHVAVFVLLYFYNYEHGICLLFDSEEDLVSSSYCLLCCHDGHSITLHYIV